MKQKCNDAMHETRQPKSAMCTDDGGSTIITAGLFENSSFGQRSIASVGRLAGQAHVSKWAATTVPPPRHKEQQERECQRSLLAFVHTLHHDLMFLPIKAGLTLAVPKILNQLATGEGSHRCNYEPAYSLFYHSAHGFGLRG